MNKLASFSMATAGVLWFYFNYGLIAGLIMLCVAIIGMVISEKYLKDFKVDWGS